jgi:hypothetical protein
MPCFASVNVETRLAMEDGALSILLGASNARVGNFGSGGGSGAGLILLRGFDQFECSAQRAAGFVSFDA